ncbi:hypothetical protein PGT21_018066 [Puccinia graminis f. sp. tritici]|uniref:RING-type domain-containing protein n=1 Tax=Puccinia graminis f. sp. tritici TaxID=56615 RepID=A0A5B0M298_PUCGR|nr:hypothetical protein PGTUg99_020675 [Puccinia graminis f. sp. tritici]KAA1094332.1 hypothetical protein PGT21_018066 [Puccinia graminis f. sp. tritici]
MLFLIQSLRLIALFEVSVLIYGLPLEDGATSSNNFRKLRQSYKSIKQKCTKSVQSGAKRLNPFSSTSTEPHVQTAMPECSVCKSEITNRQEVFQSPTCIEGHTVHKACLGPRYTVEPSSCPTCQAVAHSVQQQEAVAPVISHQKEHPQTPESKPDGCSICLEEWSEMDERTKWPGCDHLFHTSCVGSWRNVKEDGTCPLCRREDPQPLGYLTDDEEEEEVRQATPARSFSPGVESVMDRLAGIQNAEEAAEVERWARVFEARESAAISHRLRQMMRERRAR